MERDFMGLNSKASAAIVKEEILEECKGSEFVAFSKASAVQWPVSYKGSVPSNFMSFKPAPEEEKTKALSEQKVQNGPGGLHLSMPSYYPDAKMFPAASRPISVSMSNPFFKTHFGGSAQNFAGVTVKQQFIGGVPVMPQHSVLPTVGSVAGTTEPRFNSKPSGSPPQLTIFYAGTVNVYDNISPEKAQAIMFLAGNGSTKVAQSRAQTQVPASKQGGSDAVHVTPQPANTISNSGLSSPISVSSHPLIQSGSGSTTNDEVMAIKPTSVLSNPISNVDSPKIVSLIAPNSGTTMASSAVPQARKASLARFLEKRKERVMSSAPYNFSKISSETATSGSNGY